MRKKNFNFFFLISNIDIKKFQIKNVKPCLFFKILLKSILETIIIFKKIKLNHSK